MLTRSTRSRSFQRALLLMLLVTFAGATGCSQLPREHWWQFWRKKPTMTSSIYNPDSVTVPPPPDAAGRNPGASALSPDSGLPAPPGGVIDANPLRRAPAGTVTELRTIHFAYDSDQITPENQATLNANAEYLKANPGLEIMIEGHTDERGTTEYNLGLGDRRAKAVKAYLMSKGVQDDRLHTTSYGKERPANAGHSEASYAQNRRAQFLVY